MKRKLRLLCACALLVALMGLNALAATAYVTANKATIYADAACTWPSGTLSRYGLVTVTGVSGDVLSVTRGGRSGYARASDFAYTATAGTAATIKTDTRVYKTPSESAASAKASAGLQVRLIAKNDTWAMIARGDIVAFIKTADLSETSDPVVAETYAAVVTQTSLSVYRSANQNATRLATLPRGTTLTVYAHNSTWAYVGRGSARGFVMLSGLAAAQATAEPTATPAATTAPSADYVNDTSLTVEKRIYLYLTRAMGLNTAAACGILANVERECDFNVNDQSYDGGYGIVQWTGSRNTKLKNWCAENGYSYTTLEGQLHFLDYELNTTQLKTLTYLKGVSNTASGAYDAAYYFCYYFEIPANRASQAVRRGNIARDTYWKKYGA